MYKVGYFSKYYDDYFLAANAAPQELSLAFAEPPNSFAFSP